MIHILTSDRLVIHPPSNYPYQEEVTIAGQRYMLLDPAAAWRKGTYVRSLSQCQHVRVADCVCCCCVACVTGEQFMAESTLCGGERRGVHRRCL
jgi:hypothetical protein